MKISFLCVVTQCSLARTNNSVKVSTAVIKAHVLCPDSTGSKFLLNVGRYLQFTFQMNRGLKKGLVFENCDYFVKVNP